jgi:surface antigen
MACDDPVNLEDKVSAKMAYKFAAPLFVTALILAGCQPGGEGVGGMGQKQTGGALIGAGLGGLAGSQLGGGSGKLVTTALGVILGGLVGSEAGKSLDRADQAYMNQQTSRALESAPTNQPTSWRNPDSGYQASVTPTRTYQQANGAYCREYSQSIIVGGKPQSAYGTACRQPDGAWQVVS